ncbi:MAG: DUF3012 domain-containing protein [Methylococcaceae bacterium]|nr:DUF3012 domain-containing protein [Methylococcaceae bacterium]
MTIISKVTNGTLALAFLVSITACSPEVGSDQWCNNMKEKPKGDLTFNDAGNFAKHCLLK